MRGGIELLPRDTLELLTIGAVLGKEFDPSFAAKLLALSPASGGAWPFWTRPARGTWSGSGRTEGVSSSSTTRSATPCWPGSRPNIAASCITALPTTCSEADPGRIFDLAYHFDAAGDHESALPYALQAAQQARAQHALDSRREAIPHRPARRRLGRAVPTRYEIAEGLGDVLMLRGHYDEAAELFETALGLAEGTFAEAQIRGKLGELDFKRGDMASAAVAFEDALRLLGKRVPQSTPLVRPFMLLWEATVQALHTLFPSLFVGRRKRAAVEAGTACAFTCSPGWRTPTGSTRGKAPGRSACICMA